MSALVVVKQTVWQEGSPILMARLTVDKTGALLTQAAINEIQHWVALKGGTIEVASTTLTIADVVYDTLQQDTSAEAIWTADSAVNLGTDGRWGYNFLHRLPSTDLPDGKKTYLKTYRFEDKSTPTAFWSYLKFELMTVPHHKD